MFTPVTLKQGGRGWLAYRANKLNASDAPAAMGVHPTRSRRSLVRQLATGVTQEFSQFVQDRVLDKGHEFERLAGELMAQHAGVDLYPVVGYDSDAPEYSASYDGLGMEWRIASEHKSLNEVLRECMYDGCTGTDLPIYHQVQMEHQCMVCPTIERVLFMASKWDRNGNLIEERHCWYTPNPSLRAQLLQAWASVQEEANNYDPASDAVEVLEKKEHEALPVLKIDVHGQVLDSNLKDFERVVKQRISMVSTELVTDQDFADAVVDGVFMRDVAAKMREAVKSVRGKMQSVDEVLKMLEALELLADTKAIAVEKLVKAEKDKRKSEILVKAQTDLDAHIAALNKDLGASYITRTIGPFDAVSKGLRSLESISKKCNEALMQCKVDADALAQRYRTNREHLEHADGSWMSLFADFATVGGKEPDDFKGIALLRITKHKDELAAAETARQAREAAELAARAPAPPPPAPAPAQVAEPVVMHTTGGAAASLPRASQFTSSEVSAAMATGAAPLVENKIQQALQDDGSRINIGQIKEKISPLSIDAAGLEELGYPVVETIKGSKMYREVDLVPMIAAMMRKLRAALEKAETPL